MLVALADSCGKASMSTKGQWVWKKFIFISPNCLLRKTIQCKSKVDSYKTGNEVYPSLFLWCKLEKAWFNIVPFSPPGNLILKRSNLGQPPTGVPINRTCPLYLLSLCKVSGFNFRTSKTSMTSICRKLWSVNVLYFLQ